MANLVCVPAIGTLQREFENWAMGNIDLHPGVFSIKADNQCYLKVGIQDLWEMFQESKFAVGFVDLEESD